MAGYATVSGVARACMPASSLKGRVVLPPPVLGHIPPHGRASRGVRAVERRASRPFQAAHRTPRMTVVRAAADSPEGHSVQSSSVSSGIKLKGITKTFKGETVLHDVTWEVKKGEKVGLIGVNGAGKTTQLQIITGKILADGGEVVKARADLRVAMLSQEFGVQLGRTLREEFLSAFEEAVQNAKRQEEIQAALENVGEDMDAMGDLLDELTHLTATAVELDTSLIEKQTQQMMAKLGFSPDDSERLVASFSGGWQMRMCLGKILLQDPDLLLLDEPTNHLDLAAIEWLEGYLREQEIPMVIVSHDREFLDRLCTKIVETERGVTQTYKGNYSAYVAQKREAQALQWAAWEKQQKEMQRQSDIVARLSAGARSGRASTAAKALENLKSEGVVVAKPFVPKRRHFTFPNVEQMGLMALQIQNLTHGYDDNKLLSKVNLVVERGERVALIGPNGAGKSTLLRLILGLEKPWSGTVELGQHSIVPNYFEQNQAEALDPNISVLETLERAAPDARMDDIKALLGRMMFTGSAQEKTVKWLSGGEKARLALAKFMLTKGTLLVLDEPTNHLDIPSKETLEEALQAFQGSVVVVSHDRYFLKKVATRVVGVGGGKLTDYQGDYEFFLSKNKEEGSIMKAKAERDRDLEKSQIKAKSKKTKAEKMQEKKAKAQQYSSGANSAKKATKNAKRWA
ncbi:hypothetical protein ACKKBF_B34805 [Auxenochlorella protothecoides x Auxenochlorella symbiontica]